MANKVTNVATSGQYATGPEDPKKEASPAETINNAAEDVVNSEEQNEILNDGAVNNQSDSSDKQKGYEEGTRNDSLTETEPEYQDSDDQPEFPGEAGK